MPAATASRQVGGEVLRAPLDLTRSRTARTTGCSTLKMDNTAPLVKFWVRDNGPGIPPEVLPKIFQPYFTTKGPRQGTGLGLNIVQRLIKEGNGACTSTPNPARHDLHGLSARPR
jgi:signal transduction histidine kinase